MNNIKNYSVGNIDADMEEYVKESFKVTDLSSADWCFERIKHKQEKLNEIQSYVKEKVEQINKWYETEKTYYENDIAYFEGLLKEYYRENKEIDNKFRLSVPNGSVTARKSKKWQYNDSEVLQFLKANEYNNLIKVTESINKVDLKKVFKDGINQETGEVLEGVEIIEEESITVKVV